MHRRTWNGLVFAALAILVSACGQSNRLAPVVFGDNSRASGETRAPVAVGGAVTVQRGDSLYKIAERHDVPLRALIDANRIAPPYTIFPGQKLNLPLTGGHVVSQGETVYGISERYGVEPGALVRVNRLSPPYRLVPGQRLALPGGGATSVAGGSGPRTVATASPAPSAPSAASRPPAGEPAQTRPPSDASQPTSAPQQASAPPPAASAPAETRTAARSIDPPPAQSGSGFLWPLQGRVLSRFGTQGKGLRNDGINIQANRGAPVRAVENGVVAYAGNELRGFGNLLLIKHEDGWISAYAHNDEVLVRTGERVRKGQVVSRVGSTGSVDSPQLHFELRRGNRAVDPERFIRPQAALLRMPAAVSRGFS
ncbi:MAG: LysM peptidoglycan-binding domain-containing M23 family metallopeptidase [Rhodospirillaceae bacterium]